MSDTSETYSRLPSPLGDSSIIRQQYSQPPRKSWRTVVLYIPEVDPLDYSDEKDFRNTDRYIVECILLG